MTFDTVLSTHEKVGLKDKVGLFASNTLNTVQIFLGLTQTPPRPQLETVSDILPPISLEQEFDQFTKRVPQISEPFDPGEELSQLRSTPGPSRSEKLSAYKSKLARQNEAWATCRLFLRQEILSNHDVPKENLTNWINRFAASYGFTSRQLEIAGKIIDDYYIYRQRAVNIRQEYPDNIALVKELSGIKVSSSADLKVDVGLMAIDITCDRETASRIYYSSSENPPLFQNRAFATYSRHELPVKYNVFTTDMMRPSSKPHEDQHQENMVVTKHNPQEPEDKMKSLELFWKYEAEKDLSTKRKLLEQYLRIKRKNALDMAKDEIIAMKSCEDTYPWDMFFRQDGSTYDYLSTLRNMYQNALYQECSNRVLVEEYRYIIENAIAAFDLLVQKNGSTYKTISLLSEKPLNRWPKLVKRQLSMIESQK